MENQQYKQEDEMDLRDYINVIIKRRKLILAIFLVSIVAAIVANLLMPKVYEISSTIQLGSVGDEFLIKKAKAKEIILNQNSLLSIIKELNLKIDLEDLQNDIKVDSIEDTNLLTIRIVYPSLDMVFKIHDAIVNPLIAQGQSLYQGRLALTSKWIEELEQDIKDLEQHIKNIEAEINKVQTWISERTNSRNLSQVADSGRLSQAYVNLKGILLANKGTYENNLIMLEQQLNNLRFTYIVTKDFMIFDAPIKPKNPIKLRKLNVLIVGIISLLFGAFLAFFMESWQKGKE